MRVGEYVRKCELMYVIGKVLRTVKEPSATVPLPQYLLPLPSQFQFSTERSHLRMNHNQRIGMVRM